MPANYFRGTSLLILLSTAFVRWCVSLFPYSGAGKPPMFGDYEAQRHWMEITYNLPSSEWYFNTSKNDLEYWGLDYPPLTAYHSKLCGYIAALLNPKFVSLGASRGYESPEHKLFMRMTVFLGDLLVLYPAVWLFWKSPLPKRLEGDDRGGDGSGLSFEAHRNLVWRYLALMYPGLILIDHGHFQYNGISLGFAIAAVAAIFNQRQLVASCLFVLSLSFKQMSLYYALPFFFYLLGNSLQKGLKSGLIHIALLGGTVIATFLLVWLPFLTNVQQILQVLHRLFPLARGVFEDKVANIWCAVNVLYKLHLAFSNQQMAKICLCTTALAVSPSCIHVLLRPKQDKFILALINSSLGFFLFSFQVHEKGILLVAIPVILYTSHDTLPCVWFLAISIFSMLPLLIKDGLIIPSIALTMFYVVSAHLMVGLFQSDVKKTNARSNGEKNCFFFKIAFFNLSMLGCVILSFCTVTLDPPKPLPDLYPLLISVYSCGHFCLFFIYFNYCQIFKPTCIKQKRM